MINKALHNQELIGYLELSTSQQIHQEEIDLFTKKTQHIICRIT